MKIGTYNVNGVNGRLPNGRSASKRETLMVEDLLIFRTSRSLNSCSLAQFTGMAIGENR